MRTPGLVPAKKLGAGPGAGGEASPFVPAFDIRGSIIFPSLHKLGRVQYCAVCEFVKSRARNKQFEHQRKKKLFNIVYENRVFIKYLYTNFKW